MTHTAQAARMRRWADTIRRKFPYTGGMLQKALLAPSTTYVPRQVCDSANHMSKCVEFLQTWSPCHCHGQRTGRGAPGSTHTVTNEDSHFKSNRTLASRHLPAAGNTIMRVSIRFGGVCRILAEPHGLNGPSSYSGPLRKHCSDGRRGLRGEFHREPCDFIPMVFLDHGQGWRTHAGCGEYWHRFANPGIRMRSSRAPC